jgi:hypothetical protein
MRSVRLVRALRRAAPQLVASGAVVIPDMLGIYGGDLLTWRDSRDVTELGGLLTAWPDRVGGAALTIVGAPTVAADATLNSLLTVGCDGIAAACQFAMDRPVPSAGSPTCLIFVMKQITWTSARTLWGTGSNTLCANQVTGSPGFILRNGVIGPLNSGLTLDTWKMVIAQYSNETTDYSQIGQAAKITGTATGVLDPTGVFTFGARTGGAFSHTAWATVAAVQRKPDAGDIAATIAWFDSIYPPAVAA